VSLCVCVFVCVSLSLFLSFSASPLWPYPFGNIEGMGDQEVDLSETAVV
jgi:hypothetical protein